MNTYSSLKNVVNRGTKTKYPRRRHPC